MDDVLYVVKGLRTKPKEPMLQKSTSREMLENDLSRKEVARNGSGEELKRFDFSGILARRPFDNRHAHSH